LWLVTSILLRGGPEEASADFALGAYQSEFAFNVRILDMRWRLCHQLAEPPVRKNLWNNARPRVGAEKYRDGRRRVRHQEGKIGWAPVCTKQRTLWDWRDTVVQGRGHDWKMATEEELCGGRQASTKRHVPLVLQWETGERKRAGGGKDRQRKRERATEKDRDRELVEESERRNGRKELYI
jgi:hypothetical protein